MSDRPTFRALLPEEPEKELSQPDEDDRVIVIDTLSEDSFPVRRANGKEFDEDDYGWLVNLFQYLMREALERDIMFRLAYDENEDDSRKATTD